MTFEQRKKVNFVNNINNAAVPVQPNVKAIEYHIFENTRVADVYREFLVIKYKGDAMSCICCNGNSCSAILREISTCLDTGYYGQVQSYLRTTESEEWKEAI